MKSWRPICLDRCVMSASFRLIIDTSTLNIVNIFYCSLLILKSSIIIITFVLQMVSAMSYLHDRKIAHGDIKPENMLINCHFQVKLIDFGFAQRYTDTSIPFGTRGTIAFNSPEMHHDKL